MDQHAWPSTFPALRQRVNGHPLAFLDSAATTLRPQSVIDAVAEYYATDNANPSRVHTLASRAADRLAAARQALARFTNASDPAEIVFVRGTTEGINLVAGLLRRFGATEAVRASAYVYSTRGDIDRLVDALLQLIADSQAGAR
jgi:selenocysteine lyase/cysteine desulfurase